MQVARLLDPHDKTIPGKFKQMLRALQLEWHLSKQEILTLYLNHAPFGGPIEGVQAASYTYFGKTAGQLTRAEAALLAVLPQAPSYYRPDRYPQRARAARDKVLERLAVFEQWQPSAVNEAKREPVIAQYNARPMIAPLLARRLANALPHRRIIQTRIDSSLQLAIEQVVAHYIQTFPEKTSAAVLLVENQDMGVSAYIGSADFGNQERYGHVDMIQATRSPGSTLKPFLYGMALDQGLIHEQSLLMDIPSEFAGYQPENFDEGFNGPIAARDALRRSLNVPAVQLLDALEPSVFYANLASAGMKLQLPNSATPNLSLILGGAGTDLQTLTQSFAALGRKGLVRPLQFLADPPATSLTKSGISAIHQERRLLSAEAAWIIANILSEGGLERFSQSRVIARQQGNIAFKTGTSYGYRDAWVLATTRDYTLGVWVGRPDGTPLTDNYGRHTAVPLLQRLLPLLANDQRQLPEKPARVTRHQICWPLGSLQRLQEKHWCMQEKTAWLIDQMAPVNTLGDPLNSGWSGVLQTVWLNAANERLTAECGDGHYQKTFALWPQSLHPWLPAAWRRDAVLPPLADHCQPSQTHYRLQIDGIEPNSELHPPPGKNTLPAIELRIKGEPGPVHWFVNGHWHSQAATLLLEQLPPGRHEISAMDAAGQIAWLRFRVGQ